MNIAIIPARKNSKRIKNKNIKFFFGKPVISYAIKCAKKSTLFHRIIVSTDSEKIAKIGKKLQIDVPFIRPKKLSTSNSSSLDVIIHTLDFLKRTESYEPDIILFLQVTSPLRQLKSIDSSIIQLQKSNATSILGVSQMKQNPSIAFKIDKNKYLQPYQKTFHNFSQRQKFPKFYYPSGSIYTFWKKTLESYGNIYGPRIKPLIVSKEESIDIDDIFDLFVCENVIKNWNKYKKKFSNKGVKF